MKGVRQSTANTLDRISSASFLIPEYATPDVPHFVKKS